VRVDISFAFFNRRTAEGQFVPLVTDLWFGVCLLLSVEGKEVQIDTVGWGQMENEEYNPDDWPNDYSNPRAVASKFESLDLQIREIRKGQQIRASDGWLLGVILAMILSWSRNASILYGIGHGILSWIYVIYFAFTRPH
jgi:hypothetical protein